MLYKPFLERYPELSRLVKYVYVSLMSPSDAIASRGYTMHGMHEAYQDMYKACLQDIASQDDFLRYESCLVDHQGEDNFSYVCLEEQGRYDDVAACVRERGAKLGKRHNERFVALGSYASPIVFIEGKQNDFDWTEGPDTFARVLCGYPALANDPACANVRE